MRKTKVSEGTLQVETGSVAAADEGQDKKTRVRRQSSDSEDNTAPLQSGVSKLMDNEMRSFRNRGFHDGYDEGKKSTLQSAYDGGYKKAFEQNFILSTLKGVANALKSSHRNSQKCASSGQHHSRPTSAISSASTPASSSAASSTTSTPHSTIGRRSVDGEIIASSEDTSEQICSISSRQSPSRRRRLYHHHRHSGGGDGGGSGDNDGASTCSTSSSASSNLSSSNTTSTTGCYGSSSYNFNVSISSNHMSLLESMKFDQSSDIESIKKDLIKICRENRLEILAHYVSQIG